MVVGGDVSDVGGGGGGGDDDQDGADDFECATIFQSSDFLLQKCESSQEHVELWWVLVSQSLTQSNPQRNDALSAGISSL